MRSTVILFLALFAGCKGTPCALVPPTQETVLDDRLIGVWQLDTEEEKPQRRPIVSFGRLKDVVVEISEGASSTYAICFRQEDQELPFQGRLHDINGSTYLSLQRPPSDQLAIAGTTLRPYFFAKCLMQANQIHLIGCDGSAFRARLREDGLPFVELDAGTVFTGTSDQLRELFDEHSADLFPQRSGDVILRKASLRSAVD